jgi:hypothetical protein
MYRVYSCRSRPQKKSEINAKNRAKQIKANKEYLKKIQPADRGGRLLSSTGEGNQKGGIKV